MSRKSKRKQSKGEATKEDDVNNSTLEAIEAMSSDSGDDGGSVGENNQVWNEQAEALRRRIQEGAYDRFLEQHDSGSNNSDSESTDSDKKKQDELDDDALFLEVIESEEEDGVGKEKEDKSEDNNNSDNHDFDSESESDEEDDKNEDEKEDAREGLYHINSKALKVKTEEMLAEKGGFPWVEKFDVIPPTALPFGQTDEKTGLTVEVHDDLKREVAFYNTAMEAVEMARQKCKEIGVPFSRPEDFFAEMVKSDDHMARVKDRLIYENKKIEAVAQRKSNREQKLRAKEAHSNKLAEKSQRRKENMKAADDWAQLGQASSNVNRMSVQKRGWTDRDGNVQPAPNKKRIALDKKYGYGGKTPRFKQNSQADLNDMSGFNPKAGKGGGPKKKKGGSGANRKGKRARDAGRARQR